MTTTLPLGQIQKLYSSPHWVCLGIFDGRVRHYLYVGRGASYEGLALGEGFPPAYLRVKDRFLEYLRAHIEGRRLTEWVKDKKDRLLLLRYGADERFIFFWRGPKLYFLHYFLKEGERKLFLSWRSSERMDLPSWEKLKTDEELFSYFDEIGRTEHAGEIISKRKISEYLKEQESRRTEKGLSSTRKKFFQRKIERIEEDLKKVAKWTEWREKAEAAPTYEERNKFYEKSKKWRQAEGLLKERLATAQKEKVLEEQKPKHLVTGEKTISPVFDKGDEKKEALKTQKTDHEIEIFQSGKLKMAVGMSAAGNDYLRREWASKDDWWFHMEGERSAHLVIKTQNLSDITDELFEIIGSMIKDYSSSSFAEIPLIFAQVKNLKGIKGAKGSVTISKPRYRRIPYRSDWKNKLSSLS